MNGSLNFVNRSNFSTDEYGQQFGVPEWTPYLHFVFMLIVSLVGLSGNGIVALIQVKLKDKSSTDYIVLTMALTDLICSACVPTFYMARDIWTIWEIVRTHLFCKLNYFVVYGANISSTMLFAALAFDRYMRTCHPFSAIYTCTKSKIVCSGIVLVSFLIATSALLVFKLNDDSSACAKSEDFRIMETILNLCLTGTFVLLFTMVVFCYIKVSIKINKRNLKKNQLRENILSRNRPAHRYHPLIRQRKIEPLLKNPCKSLLFGQRYSSAKSKVSIIAPHCSSNVISCQTGSGNETWTSSALRTIQAGSSNSSTLSTWEIQTSGKDQSAKTSVVPLCCILSENESSNSTDDSVSSKHVDGFCGENRMESINNAHASSYSKTGLENKTDFRDKKIDHVTQQQQQQQPKQQNIHQQYQQRKQRHRLQQHSAQQSLKNKMHRHLTEETSESYHDVFSDAISERLQRDNRKVNYVTLMMFVITMTYVLTWVSNWLLYAIMDQKTVIGRVVIYLSKTLFVLNYMTNPIFFTLMSENFRERFKALICKKK